jgi:hypothetical protein
VILIKRGFLSSNDVAPTYLVIADSQGRITGFALHCLCGNIFPIEPIDGIYKWKHRNCLVGTLELEGYAELFIKKKKNKK